MNNIQTCIPGGASQIYPLTWLMRLNLSMNSYADQISYVCKYIADLIQRDYVQMQIT